MGEGVYALLIRSGGGEDVRAGAWGELRTRKGYYLYIGRARRGLAARIERHARRSGKRLKWHIDYLLEVADPLEAWLFGPGAGECETASSIEESGGLRIGLERFGASDCRCPGHLLYMGAGRPLPPPRVVDVRRL